MPHIIETALQLVDQDRRGHKIDHSLVKGLVDTLVEIGSADVLPTDPDDPSEHQFNPLPTLDIYIRVFEDDFLALTRTFYKAEGDKMVAIGNATQFMKNVLARLDEEVRRGNRLLHPDSASRLRKVTEEKLIGDHIEYLQKEAGEMVKAGREDDLRLVYTLLNRIENGLSPLRAFFVGFIRAEGNSVVVDHIAKMAGKDDMQSNLELIRVLIRLYRKHANLVKRCFESSHLIMMGIDDAFRGFVNRALGNISLCNLIAHYVDHVLRLGKDFDREMWDIKDIDAGPTRKKPRLADDVPSNQDASVGGFSGSHLSTEASGQSEHVESAHTEDDDDESPLSQYLSELVRLIMYLDEKDLFFETHRRLFAKRLMSNHDEELEMSFINKIKVQMGPTYTQRLSGMLKDKLVSHTMREEFRKYMVEKREELVKQKEEVTRAALQEILDEDFTNPVDNCPVDNCADRNEFERMVTASILEDIELPRIQVATRTMAPPQPNRTSGWSMLLDVTNAHVTSAYTEKGKAERKEREEKSKKIYENILKFEDALRIDFNTHVLNALHWPAVKVADLRLPPVLHACQELFSDFYMRDKETRKLTWIHTLSTVNLLGTFSGKSYTLVVSTFQACILLLFNDCDRIQVSDACKQLNLTRDELSHHMKPLMLGRKCRVLRLEKRANREVADALEKSTGGSSSSAPNGSVSNCTEPTISNQEPSGCQNAESRQEAHDASERAENRSKGLHGHSTQGLGSSTAGNAEGSPNPTIPDCNAGKDVNKKGSEQSNDKRPQSETTRAEQKQIQDADVIHINLGFKSRLHRVVVPANIAKVAIADTAVSKRNVVVDRSTQVDAMLVRIMKAKKEITHAALNAEVIQALAPMFLPDPRLIKTRLERLIDQEYVERDSNEPRLYRYAT